MDKLSLHLRIEGRVQGVWYRGWMIEQARALRLDGWVRNRHDGTVEALVSGADLAVETLLAACRRGPPAALVTAVSVTPAEPPSHSGFHKQPTG